jgi:hypothetical protein
MAEIVKPLKKYTLTTDTAKVWEEFAWRGDRLAFVQNDTTDLQVMFDEKGSEQDIFDIPKISFGSRQVTIEYHPVDGKPLYFSKVFLKHSAVAGGKITAIVGGEASIVTTASGLSDADVTNPTEMRGIVRDEDRDYARDFPVRYLLGNRDMLTDYVHSMLHYKDKVLVGLTGSGEIWVLDENGWSMGYQPAVQPPSGYNRGAFFAHCFFTAKDLAVMAGQDYEPGYGMVPHIITFDGSTFKRYWFPYGGSFGIYEFYFAEEYNDKLYVGGAFGYPNGAVYESSDGVTFTQIRTFTGETPRCAAVFGGRLYVGMEPTGNVYSFDGTTWSLVATLPYRVYSAYSPKTGIMGVALFFGGLGGRVYRTTDGSTYTLAARLPGEFSIFSMVKSSVGGFYICGESGRAAHGALYHYRNVGQYAVEPVAITDSAVIDASEFMGTVLLGTGAGSVGENIEETGFIIPLKPGERRLSQVDIRLWDSASISANAETDPVATLGWAKKAVFFKSDTAGTLTIYIDPVGDGTWEIYDTVTIALNTFTPYTFPQESNFARLKLAFDQAAVVDAYVVVTP